MSKVKDADFGDDPVTQKLLGQGVYSVNVQRSDANQSSAGAGHRAHYGFWGGLCYMTALLIFLWWLPVIGQMIAGYIGGRRAGTPTKAFFAALTPAFAIWAFFWLLAHGLMPFYVMYLISLPQLAMTYLTATLPALASYVYIWTSYASVIVDQVRNLLSYSPGWLLVLMGFAVVGGSMTEVKQSASASGGSASGTTGPSSQQYAWHNYDNRKVVFRPARVRPSGRSIAYSAVAPMAVDDIASLERERPAPLALPEAVCVRPASSRSQPRSARNRQPTKWDLARNPANEEIVDLSDVPEPGPRNASPMDRPAPMAVRPETRQVPRRRSPGEYSPLVYQGPDREVHTALATIGDAGSSLASEREREARAF